MSMPTIPDGHQSQSPLSPQPSSTHSVASIQSVASLAPEPTYSSTIMQQEKVEDEASAGPQPQMHLNKAIPDPQVSHPPVQQESSINGSNRSFMFQYQHNDSSSNLLNSNMNLQQRNTLQQRQQNQSRYSRKQKVKEYVKREIAKFFGVDILSEEEERIKWFERQKRLAIRCFGQLRDDMDISNSPRHQGRNEQLGYRPDILPAQNTEETERTHYKIERKASVATMLWNGISYLVSRKNPRKQKQWSRSFAPAHVKNNDDNDLCDGLSPIQSDEAFFDSPGSNQSSQDVSVANRQMY